MVGSTPEGRKLVEDMHKKGWVYLGGEATTNNKAHTNYWELSKNSYNLTDEDKPAHSGICKCGEQIRYNCWILNKETREIKIIGGVCIKKFTGGKLRVCDECGEPHRNRVINKCNECRVGWCNCGASINPCYKKCYDCYMNK